MADDPRPALVGINHIALEVGGLALEKTDEARQELAAKGMAEA